MFPFTDHPESVPNSRKPEHGGLLRKNGMVSFAKSEAVAWIDTDHTPGTPKHAPGGFIFRA